VDASFEMLLDDLVTTDDRDMGPCVRRGDDNYFA
jgi:hypothetical protein